jgi:hypothetical protein
MIPIRLSGNTRIIDYFRVVDGNTTPIERAPGVVTHVRAESNAFGVMSECTLIDKMQQLLMLRP